MATATKTCEWCGSAVRRLHEHTDFFGDRQLLGKACGCFAKAEIQVRQDQRAERAYDDDLIDGVGFADPGGRSALRAEVGGGAKCPGCGRKTGKRWSYCAHCGERLNPRCHPCGLCGREDQLTDLDVARKYVCDGCADAREAGGYSYGEY